ncbi:MAG: hypothetical protein ISR58_09560 [Anaerolineales bacterium]|nr:hypothetical protein [Chloroflexota bacterium]MBL6981423.1 hypothetical protein [Anaerolineales bacterium]
MKNALTNLLKELTSSEHGNTYLGILASLILLIGCFLGLFLSEVIIQLNDFYVNKSAVDGGISSPQQNDLLATEIALAIPTQATVIPTSKPPNTPTPEPTPRYPGYSKVVTLPDNSLLIQNNEINMENVIDSLAIVGRGGGGGCPLEGANEWGICTARDLSSRGKFAYINIPEGYPNVRIDLVKPDGTLVDVNANIEEGYCLNHELLLQPGTYQAIIAEPKLKPDSVTFEFYREADPIIFLNSCRSEISARIPFQIFFSGFQPSEDALVALYSGYGIVQDQFYEKFDLINSWVAEMDENGKLVQQIMSPQVLDEDDYYVVVYGKEQRPFEIVENQSVNASAVLRIRVSR